MITAQELRIGNIVYVDNEKHRPEDRIINHIVIQIGLIDCIIQNTSAGNEYGQYYKFIKPIPLTEQWLIDFGFEKIGGFDDEQFFRIKTDENLLIDVYETMTGFETEQGLKIEGVHHLQNYVHSGIGKELIKK